MRFALTTILVLITFNLTSAGCDQYPAIDNVAPRLTWLAVEATSVDAEGQRSAKVYVWIADYEGDPVDLDVAWIDETTQSHPLLEVPGGHGLDGLTTRNKRDDPNGQVHVIFWDQSELPDGPVRLRMTPRDSAQSVGVTVESPSFDPAIGLNEAQLLVPAN